MGGFPEAEHLIYLLLLEEGDGGVDPEYTKDTGEAVMHMHGALPVTIGVMLNQVRGDKGSRGAIIAGGARVVGVFVR